MLANVLAAVKGKWHLYVYLKNALICDLPSEKASSLSSCATLRETLWCPEKCGKAALQSRTALSWHQVTSTWKAPGDLCWWEDDRWLETTCGVHGRTGRKAVQTAVPWWPTAWTLADWRKARALLNRRHPFLDDIRSTLPCHWHPVMFVTLQLHLADFSFRISSFLSHSFVSLV